MKYVAVRDCTDIGGRFVAKGQIVELDGKARHSKYLEKVEAEKPDKSKEPKEPEKAKESETI